MALMQELLAWTKGLQAWQSDALARLLAKKELSPADQDDLYALLKVAHGIPDPEKREPLPLAEDQIPAPIQAETEIELLVIKNLRNVNAIAENQQLEVGAKGLTVIYGSNGSGKSGYSRVLKRACRARDQSEQILPNANVAGAKMGNAQATFTVCVNGQVDEYLWQQGREAPKELSALSIFDTRCARAYLDSEDDFAYVPYGLDVLDSLAKLYQQLKIRLEAEQREHAVDLQVFAHLKGETAVGRLIDTLSAKTDPEAVEGLANITNEELLRKQTLEESLKENNPKEKAVALGVKAKRVDALATRAEVLADALGLGAIAKLKGLVDECRDAQAAAAVAAKAFKEGEKLLPGTGGQAWRELFDAAKRFALESHPDCEFPDLGVDAACPLCQQPLDAGAQRLQRFEAFIQADVERTAQERKEALAVVLDPLVKMDLTLNLDAITEAELSGLDPLLIPELREFEGRVQARHLSILKSVETLDWAGPAEELINPGERLLKLEMALNQEAEALEQAADENERKALLAELSELQAREKLGMVKDAVLVTIAKLEHRLKLTSCLASVRTNGISLKASELAEKVVSKDLEAALNREFKALGVGNLSVSLQSRADRGRALHKLKLQLPQVRNPAEILSEGEQRAIAIGSFLAEVGLSGSKGGVVFDDPVSSLDHSRRERVARRLAVEANQRQVIIFTHDIYFLCLLVEEAKQVGAPVLTQSLTKRPDGVGVADPELPVEGKSASKRISALKAQHQTLAKLYREGNQAEHERMTVDAYFRLRMAWERAVEEVLLREVILRFRKGIETQRLLGVSVEDDDYAKITAGMSKCSNYAHDKAMIGGVAVPEPDELLADIQALDEWRATVVKRSEETVKKRKAGPVPV